MLADNFAIISIVFDNRTPEIRCISNGRLSTVTIKFHGAVEVGWISI